MFHKKVFVLLAVLILALLACNLPATQSGPQPDGAAATITEMAAIIAAQSTPLVNDIPTNTALPTDTPTPTATATVTETPTITLTPTPTVPMVSVSQTTNCRTGPGTQYDLIGSLAPGQTAEVVGKHSNGAYWIINNPSGSGTCWLWGQYATVTGNTANLPEMIAPPTPTPSLPAAPKAFNIDISCTLVSNPIFKNNVHVVLSWQDIANNEDGYHIYRNGTLIATLEANATSFADDTTLPAFYIVGNPPPSVTYSIEAFNGAGNSNAKDKTVSCP